ncbi:hypothetical protein FIBSPDRAFT_1052485 [Athelia psychrophila]|uniref:INO80 complex subunit B-like conserved region domain-containing protein n=1 Tax=Athelia psychrophila TaxID=1759441 RepID=A0A165X929_9AGAM|nr:hypothetical protein FIBSPDRAFT_1052485 [Fibularhizoctonia sp. CBS 109695]
MEMSVESDADAPEEQGADVEEQMDGADEDDDEQDAEPEVDVDRELELDLVPRVHWERLGQRRETDDGALGRASYGREQPHRPRRAVDIVQEEEIADRDQDRAPTPGNPRKHMNLSEKEPEDEKAETINRHLKKQSRPQTKNKRVAQIKATPQSTTKAPTPASASDAGEEDEGDGEDGEKGSA